MIKKLYSNLINSLNGLKIVSKENLQEEIDLILEGGQQGRVVIQHGE